MSESKTKIAQELTPEQLAEFCDRLYKEKPDWKTIVAIAGEYGVTVGRSAAFEFRNKEFEPWLAKLERQKNLAKFLADHADGTAAGTIADAAAAHLSQEVFEFLQESDVDINMYDEDGLEKANVLSKVIQRLRSGDHRMKALQMKIAEFEDTRKALTKALERGRQSGGGLSAEALQEIEQHLGWKPDAPLTLKP